VSEFHYVFTGHGHQHRAPGHVTGLTTPLVRLHLCPDGCPGEPNAEPLIEVDGTTGVRHVAVIEVYVHPADAPRPVVRHQVLDPVDDPTANTS